MPATATGTNRDAFQPSEWGMLTGVALIWGASFFFIDIALNAFQPGVVAMVRVILGATTLALFPQSRQPVGREHLPRIVLLGIVWIGIPMILFPVAQQSGIASSVAGMLNAAVPIFTAIWATVLLRTFPGTRQMIGISIGFLGVVAISIPELADSSSMMIGVGLVVLAVMLYGLASNLAVPLQQQYGAMPVLLRAQLAALVIIVPYGLFQISGSTWAIRSALVMIPLGMLGTALAYVLMATLVGRVGGTRGSIAIYFVPIVSIALGVLILDEPFNPIALTGTALVLVGAWITSRKET